MPTDDDFVISCLDDPAVLLVVVGETCCRHRQTDGARFARRERHFGERLQLPRRALDFRIARTDVELYDLFARDVTGVGDVDGRHHAAIRRSLVLSETKVAQLEGGVAQSEAKRKRRRRFLRSSFR